MALNLRDLDRREREAAEVGLTGFYLSFKELRPLLDLVAQTREALDLMLQAFDPEHLGACDQSCFDTSNGHGPEVQDSAKDAATAALAAYKEAGGQE